MESNKLTGIYPMDRDDTFTLEPNSSAIFNLNPPLELLEHRANIILLGGTMSGKSTIV